MKSPSPIDMVAVTRLTREGRLGDAMRLLRSIHGTNGSPGEAAAPPANAAHQPHVIDMQPPSSATGPSWTASAHASPGPRQAPAARSVPLARAWKPRMRTGRVADLPPDPLPPGALFEERMHSSAAGSRHYKLYVPATLDGSPCPLLVLLHGCTQSPDDFARGTRMNALAEEHGFLVAYPAQSQAANASRCWNWFNDADQQRDRGEPSLIAGITRDVMRAFPVDPQRVHVAGLSAGGAMAAILGAAYPDLYAAVGVHSGLAPGSAHDVPSAFAAMRSGGERIDAAARKVPTIVFHGDADATVNPVNGEQVLAHARGSAPLRRRMESGASSDGVGYTRTIEATPDGRPWLEHWLIHGGGHAWSGGDPRGSFASPHGPDASREMLRFFAEAARIRAQG